jgi:hypothetical protein
MQQLDQYHAELEAIGGGKVKFDAAIVIIIFFLGNPSGLGLGMEPRAG